jgi:hypothetical protein
MNKQILSITEYVSWLLKEYQKIKNSHSEMAIYKLIEVKENKNDGVVLVVQLNGTATIFQTTPEEVLADDALTEKFSSKDIRSIAYHACQHMAKPKSRIALKRFCQKLNKIVFGIKHFNKEKLNKQLKFRRRSSNWFYDCKRRSNQHKSRKSFTTKKQER